MSVYTFSTSSGFGTNENITLINSDIDGQIATRTNTEVIGDMIALTFSSELSESEMTIVNNIFQTRDNPVIRGDKIITIYPMINIKATTYQIFSRFPFRNWKITNIEVSGFMDPTIMSYTVRVYDPTNDQILAQKTLTNTVASVSDIGTISNLPNGNVELEIQAKITGGQTGKYVYIESVIIYYTT